MTQLTAVYPGSFTPPTYGHFAVVKQAAQIFPHVTILCSTNTTKKENRWFSEEQCRDMWHFYDLPHNVSVITFAEKEKLPRPENIIMIRGIRDENDLDHEKNVMLLNYSDFGIDKYFYICAQKERVNISSSNVRRAALACDLRTLAQCAAPLVITHVLEKALGIKNLFMVVGKPGSGKSTFLSMLQNIDPMIMHINTDIFAKDLTPLIKENFGDNADIITIALTQSDELTRLVAPLWFNMLTDQLYKCAEHDHVFVEIPYGLMQDKNTFRFVGGKILYVGCSSAEENNKRVIARGTPEHIPFIDIIPDLALSQDIAQKHHLHLTSIDTSSCHGTLRKKALSFYNTLLQEEKK